MVWYSHPFKNFPLLLVIHTVKGFGIANNAEVDVFLELFCFFNDPVDVAQRSSLCYITLQPWQQFLGLGAPDSNWVSLIPFELGEKKRMFLYVAEPEVGQFGS